MTDRFNALTVILDGDTRDDDAQDLINAIRQLRGVRHVEPHVRDLSESIIQRKRAILEFRMKIMDAIHEIERSGE